MGGGRRGGQGSYCLFYRSGGGGGRARTARLYDSVVLPVLQIRKPARLNYFSTSEYFKHRSVLPISYYPASLEGHIELPRADPVQEPVVSLREPVGSRF